MQDPDLTILALADAKLLPPEVQDPFDHWRIWKARDAVTTAVRKRLDAVPPKKRGIAELYLERLELADNEQTIFEGIYALAEVVDVNRNYLGLHSEYLILMMSSQLNPWGLVEFQQDFERPGSSSIAAAQEMWRLAQEHKVDVKALLAKIKDDETLRALQKYYASREPNPAAKQESAADAEKK